MILEEWAGLGWDWGFLIISILIGFLKIIFNIFCLAKNRNVVSKEKCKQI